MAEKETVAVQQADAKQSSEEATKKRGWNIDYSQYKIPEGTTVEKARVFTFSPKEGEENKGKTHGLTAIINGEAKTVPMYANDVEAYFEKNSKGELTHRATLDQLVGKYFFNPNQKTREDYSKYDMLEGTTVEKANVYQSKVDGEWRVRADIDGKTQRAPLSKEDVNAYFDKDKDGNRRATPEQLVGKYFNWKSEHYFEKYRMPQGVEMTNANVFKAADTGKWMVEARIDGNKVEPVARLHLTADHSCVVGCRFEMSFSHILPFCACLRSIRALSYNICRPLETIVPPAHRASLVCGLVDAPGLLAIAAICREGLTSSQCRRAWASASPPSG